MRCDIRLCQKCIKLTIEANPSNALTRRSHEKYKPNGDIEFICNALDIENEKAYPKKEQSAIVIGTLNILNDRQAKIKYNKDFLLRTGCVYLLEQLLIQDEKLEMSHYGKAKKEHEAKRESNRIQ